VRLLVVTTLFPRPAVPHHGIFVLERLRHWLAAARADEERSAVVVAPVPYVPRALAKGRYAAFRDAPREETLALERGAKLRVLHPRFTVIPKLGMSLAPCLLARAVRRCVRELVASGERFDLVDAHYLYPDAVAAAFVARDLRLPLVVTARGTDVNLVPRHVLPRRWLRWMLARASGAIAVADALRAEVVKLAPPGLPVVTLRNGVDLVKFRPVDRAAARARLGWSASARIVLSVGHLVERKGHGHAIAALARLPSDVELKVVGDGEERARLEALARSAGVAARVQFCGAMRHEELHLADSAADVLVLLSSREGWPNVLLESMACGTPVVATRVHGTPEVVRDAAVGTLVDSTEPAVVAAALKALLEPPYDVARRARVRAYAEQHSWNATVDGMQKLFESVVGRVEAAR
jgi:glycosyltransferase involved in cell wall biosynthesis